MMGLGTELACALDPALFARRALGIDLDPWQRDLVRSTRRRILVNCSRQIGKSTTTAVLATNRAIYVPNSLVLIFAPAERQSKEMLAKCKEVYRGVAEAVPSTSESVLQLQLVNGSRILSLPANEATVRGFSNPDLIIIEEASRVDDNLYDSNTPMMAAGAGRLIALSTPFGRRGWWYEAYVGDGDWQRFEVPATECPRISPEFLEHERREKGPWQFEQEYMCRFNDAEAALFSLDLIDAAFDPEIKSLWGGTRDGGQGLFVRPRFGAE